MDATSSRHQNFGDGLVVRVYKHTRLFARPIDSNCSVMFFDCVRVDAKEKEAEIQERIESEKSGERQHQCRVHDGRIRFVRVD